VTYFLKGSLANFIEHFHYTMQVKWPRNAVCNGMKGIIIPYGKSQTAKYSLDIIISDIAVHEKVPEQDDNYCNYKAAVIAQEIGCEKRQAQAGEKTDKYRSEVVQDGNTNAQADGVDDGKQDQLMQDRFGT